METDLRKPGIGMLKMACRDLDMNNIELYFIGDKKSDVETGINANGTGILLKIEENQKEHEKVVEMMKDNKSRMFIVNNFLEACEIVIKNANV